MQQKINNGISATEAAGSNASDWSVSHSLPPRGIWDKVSEGSTLVFGDT